MPPRKRSFVYAAGIALALSAPAAAVAQTQTKQSSVPVTGTGWRVECNSAGNAGKALNCRAYIDIEQSKKRGVIAALSIQYVAQVKKPVMLVQLPLGILVTEKVAVSVDGGEPQRIVIKTCTRAGCLAGSTIADAMIEKMRAGKMIKIVFFNINDQPITVTMPLAGFAAAYDKSKS